MYIDPTFMPPETTRQRKKTVALSEAELMILKISGYMNLSGTKEISKELFEELEAIAEEIRHKRNIG